MRSPPRFQPAIAACLALALGGCVSMGGAQLRCAPGERVMVDERVYFGTQRPGGEVSSAEWADFVDRTITAGFPDGFTSWPAEGRWRGADGSIVREPSHVLALVHPDDAASDAAIAGILAAYKARFEQEAVLRVRAPACVAF